MKLKGKSVYAEIRNLKTGELFSTGYNTLPSQKNPLNEIIDFTYLPPEVHAEVNAIRSLPRGVDTEDLVLVVEGLPFCCTNCKYFIWKSGIKHIKTPGGGLVEVNDWIIDGWFLEEWHRDKNVS